MRLSRRHFLALTPFIAEARSGHTIVIAEEASASERRAARELQTFLQQMTQARLPVATARERVTGPMLLVGRSPEVDKLRLDIPWGSLGDEGFALKSAGDHLVIAGGRRRGTMYGVYEFLERLGCRWYTPDCSRIPKRASIALPHLDEIQKPAFEYRELFSTPSRNLDWAARNRVNGNFSALDGSAGGKITYFPFGHSFYELVPPARYFATHPEYFSFTAGERRVTRAQLCLTNSDVIRLGTEGVLHWMGEHPDADFISISQNDTEGWCECPNCRRVEQEEGSHAGPILRFVNAIASETSLHYPRRRLDTFAYSFSETPPARVRPLPNVNIRLAPIGNCQGHPYEQCARNRTFLERLKGWQRIAGHFYVWHYFTDFWQYQLPYPNLDELIADIPLYHRHGARGMFLQADISPGYPTEFAELKSYLLAKMLWNPRIDARATIREFLRAFYGAAAPAMSEYLELTHRQVRLPPAGKGKTLWTYKSFEMEPDFLPAARRIFDRAGKAAATPSEALRVDKARLSPEWVEVLDAKKMTLRGGVWGPADPQRFTRLFQSYMTKLRSFGIERLYETHDLAATEAEYARYARPYRAVTIENGQLRAVLIPDYLARVISLQHLGSGRETLRQTTPDERASNIEAMGGLILLAHQGYLTEERHDPTWIIDSSDGRHAITLQGATANGLEFQRRLELKGNCLHTTATVTNRGNATVKLALQSRLEFQPGLRDQPSVLYGFRRVNGATVEESLLPQRDLYFGIENHTGNERPNGEWTVWNPSAGIRVRNRFSLEQAHICRLWWRGRGENKVDLCLWSPDRQLEPGESLSLDADYDVEAL
ncbi:MAG: DUF4838 domain-containing protein [Bryobacterales bacterium]|nr:DUF4838 domain-containing protein [Bryobacterales bacterium]